MKLSELEKKLRRIRKVVGDLEVDHDYIELDVVKFTGGSFTHEISKSKGGVWADHSKSFEDIIRKLSDRDVYEHIVLRFGVKG